MSEFQVALQSIRSAKSPEEVFGALLTVGTSAQLEEIRLRYNSIARVVHPDRNDGTKDAHDAMGQLNIWRTTAEEKITQGRWGIQDSGVSIQASKLYKNVIHMTTGDICDVYSAEQENGPRVVIKITIDTKDQDLVQNEAKVLKQLWEPKDKEAIHFQQYLPKLLEQTKVKVDGKERLANIIEMCEQGYTLEQIHQKYPALDPRHVAWIWKRILEGAGWVNNQKIVHGALLPSHIIVYPKNHGSCLLDWSYATGSDKRQSLKAISTKYKDFYPPEVFRKGPALPSIDVYMAAKCAVYLFGGNPQTNRIPDEVPALLHGFLEACLLPNTLMRYRDSWEALLQLTDNLRMVYGPRKFVELEM